MKYYKLKDTAIGYYRTRHNKILREDEDNFGTWEPVKKLVKRYPSDWIEVTEEGIPVVELINFKFGK